MLCERLRSRLSLQDIGEIYAHNWSPAAAGDAVGNDWSRPVILRYQELNTHVCLSTMFSLGIVADVLFEQQDTLSSLLSQSVGERKQF